MRVTSTCDSINSFFISNAPGVQQSPDVCFGGGYYFAVWIDRRNSYNEVYGARVSTTGTVLEPNGIQIGTDAQPYFYYPSVAYNGTNYFVIWSSPSFSPYKIMGRFINTNGSYGSNIFDVLTLSQSAYTTRIAWSGSNYLLCWIEYQPVGYTYTVKGCMLSSSGTPIGSIFTIADTVDYSSLAVRHSGVNYLVTFSKIVGSYNQICGRFYSTSGTPLGPYFNISNINYNCYNCDHYLGANNKFLTVWQEYRTDYDIYGNLDVSVGIEENDQKLQNHTLTSYIVGNELRVDKTICGAIYDATGKFIGNVKNGYFDFTCYSSGIYILRTVDNQICKIVKLK
ncbi:MAG: hypothetical protein ABIL44_12675 [candidate division WOR-3 bacterium]